MKKWRFSNVSKLVCKCKIHEKALEKIQACNWPPQCFTQNLKPEKRSLWPAVSGDGKAAGGMVVAFHPNVGYPGLRCHPFLALKSSLIEKQPGTVVLFSKAMDRLKNYPLELATCYCTSPRGSELS